MVPSGGGIVVWVEVPPLTDDRGQVGGHDAIFFSRY